MAEASTTRPTYLYRIMTHEEWTACSASGKYAGAALDEASGFIHLSTASQVPGTLSLFFKDVSCVVVKLLTEKVGGEDVLKFEEAPERPGDLFPHLYEANLPVTAPALVGTCNAEGGAVSDPAFLE